MPSRTKKLRGSRTHGRGQKAGRGAGKRGGRGLAGSHKHRYLWILKYKPEHFGGRGFKRPKKIVKEKKCINLHELAEKKLQPKEVKGKLILDLKAYGYDKLLGEGKLTRPLVIIVPNYSKQALEKVKAAGGEIVTNVS